MEIILLWSFVLAWMAKRGAEDLVHAVKGTPNPRYEVKKAKAKAAGQRPAQAPRYGGKEWFADLYTDALAAHTEKRRTKAKAKAHPVDDMIGTLREPKAQPVRRPATPSICPDCKVTVLAAGEDCSTCAFWKEHDAAIQREAEWKDGMRSVGDYEQQSPRRGPGTPEWEAAYQRLQDTVQAKRAEWDKRKQADAATPEEKPVRRDDDEDDQLTGEDVIANLLGWFPATQCPRCTKFIRVDGNGKPQCGCPLTNTPTADDWAIDPDSPTGRHLAGRWCGDPACDCACKRCLARMTEPGRNLCDECLTTPDTQPTADETLAQVIQFPNIKNIEKEITMPNSEATGLTTAIAFADAAADAHQTFSTAGSEGYAGALEAMGFGEGIKGLAAEAREASATATAKWAALSAAMTEFMQGREFYANNPDAPEKAALVNE